MASREPASREPASRELKPHLQPAERQALIDEGADLFNAGRYYDCHEAWETVWRSTTPEPRDLWRGLIQIAVAFYHLHERKRPDVARRVLAKGRRRVEPYAPSAVGFDIAGLLAAVEIWDRYLESVIAGEASEAAPPVLKLCRLAA